MATFGCKQPSTMLCVLPRPPGVRLSAVWPVDRGCLTLALILNARQGPEVCQVLDPVEADRLDRARFTYDGIAEGRMVRVRVPEWLAREHGRKQRYQSQRLGLAEDVAPHDPSIGLEVEIELGERPPIIIGAFHLLFSLRPHTSRRS